MTHEAHTCRPRGENQQDGSCRACLIVTRMQSTHAPTHAHSPPLSLIPCCYGTCRHARRGGRLMEDQREEDDDDDDEACEKEEDHVQNSAGGGRFGLGGFFFFLLTATWVDGGAALILRNANRPFPRHPSRRPLQKNTQKNARICSPSDSKHLWTPPPAPHASATAC